MYQLLEYVNVNSQPVTIKNSRGENGVLIGESGWNAIQETLYLYSVPGLAESIAVGGNAPLEEWLSEDEVECYIRHMPSR